jgi:hypothetical protein
MIYWTPIFNGKLMQPPLEIKYFTSKRRCDEYIKSIYPSAFRKHIIKIESAKVKVELVK